MTLKVFSLALCALLFAICFRAEAQQAKKVPRLVLVTQGPASGVPSRRLGSLQDGHRELGWIGGKNIVIERRSAEGSYQRAVAIAEEIVQLKFDVVVWSGGIEGAKQIKAIPVVVAGHR